MAFLLLQRAVLVNRSDHRSLPSTSLRRQQYRSNGISVSYRHRHSNSLIRRATAAGDAASAYETELEILERRRQELEYLLDTWTKQSLHKKRDIQYEKQWLDRLQDVIKFCYKEGRAPIQRRKGNEHSLAKWIDRQRQAKRCLGERKPCSVKMTTERIAILESMFWWVWDAHEAAWQSNFAELEKYVAKYGEIPLVSHPTLGDWVNDQRKAHKAWQARLTGETEKYKHVKQYMDDERADKLKSLPGWSWEPFKDAWEENFKELLKYVRQHKKIPPQSHPTLGAWVNDQRHAYRAWQARLKGETDKYISVTAIMNEERATKLEAVPGWSFCCALFL